MTPDTRSRRNLKANSWAKNVASAASIICVVFSSHVTFGSISVTRAESFGYGCPDAGSTSISFAPDNSSFSILFSTMDVKIETDVPSPLPTRKECYVDIDFKIPENMQLEIYEVEYRGFMSLSSSNASGIVKNNHYFLPGVIEKNNGSVGGGGEKDGGMIKISSGPLNDSFYWNSRRVEGGQLKKFASTCRGRANLRIDSEVNVDAFKPGDFAFVQLDSGDVNFSGQFKLGLAPCGAANKYRQKVCKKGKCYQFDPRTGRSTVSVD